MSRVPFASAILVTGVTSVNRYPATFLVAFAALPIMFAWVCVWVLATFGVFVKLSGDPCNSATASNNNDTFMPRLIMFLMLISFYWGMQVRSARRGGSSSSSSARAGGVPTPPNPPPPPRR